MLRPRMKWAFMSAWPYNGLDTRRPTTQQGLRFMCLHSKLATQPSARAPHTRRSSGAGEPSRIEHTRYWHIAGIVVETTICVTVLGRT